MNYNNIKGNKTCSHHLRQRTRRCARGALPRVLQCRDLVRCGVRAWRRQHEALLPCSPARTRTHGDASMRTHTLLKTRTQAQQGNAHPLTRPADLRSHAYWQASSRARRPARTCARNHRDPTGEHFLEFAPQPKLRPIFLQGGEIQQFTHLRRRCFGSLSACCWSPRPRCVHACSEICVPMCDVLCPPLASPRRSAFRAPRRRERRRNRKRRSGKKAACERAIVKLNPKPKP